MYRARQGSAIALGLVGLILFTATIGMILGWWVHSSGDPGSPPNIPIPNEKTAHVLRTRIDGTDCSLWDIRDNRTGVLKFMVSVNPVDGRPIRDLGIQSRIFSVRLALQAAYVVKSIGDEASKVEEIAANIGKLGNVAISIAESAGQNSMAKDLREFSASMGEKTQTALALAATVRGSREYAERMIKDPSEENADLFLASLGASAAVTFSQRAAFVYFIISSALQQIGSSPGPWLEMFYNQVTKGTKPTIALVESTFGAYEASITSTELTARGVY